MAAILFDLDGTLTDPGEGIMNSVRYALARFGILRPEAAALRDCIGPPLLESFQKHWRLTPAESRRALELYREYFRPRGIWENLVYPGVPELLRDLRGAGADLFIATSKPEEFARRIADRFGFSPYLSDVVGNTMAEDRSDKASVISYLLSSYPEAVPERTVMVGDRNLDAEGAAACGIGSVGVLYGYGSREELESAPFTALAASVGELREILLNWLRRN